MVCSSLIFGEKDRDITITVTIIIYYGQCCKFISLNHKSYDHVWFSFLSCSNKWPEYSHIVLGFVVVHLQAGDGTSLFWLLDSL